MRKSRDSAATLSWLLLILLLRLHPGGAGRQFRDRLERAASRREATDDYKSKLTTSVWDQSDDDRFDSTIDAESDFFDYMNQPDRSWHESSQRPSHRTRKAGGGGGSPQYLAYLNGGRVEEVDDYELYDNYNEYMRRGPSGRSAASLDSYADSYSSDGRRSRRPSIVIGKDRELFHASVDLKWMYEKATDARTWGGLLQHTVHKFKRLHTGYDDEAQYVSDAIDILIKVRHFFPKAPLRIFQGSLQKAACCAVERDRFLVLYIEDNQEQHVAESLRCRRVLAHPVVGRLLNKQFIFMPMNRRHNYAKHCLKLLEKSISSSRPSVLAYPLMIVMSPAEFRQRLAEEAAEGGLGRNKQQRNKKKKQRKKGSKTSTDLEVVAVLQMDGADVESRLVEKFLVSAYVKNFPRRRPAVQSPAARAAGIGSMVDGRASRAALAGTKEIQARSGRNDDNSSDDNGDNDDNDSGDKEGALSAELDFEDGNDVLRLENEVEHDYELVFVDDDGGADVDDGLAK